MIRNELLNEIRKETAPHVFRALNKELGLNWQKPVTVLKLAGNYTVLKIQKTAAAAGYDSKVDMIALLTRDAANKYWKGFKLVTIEDSAANIDHDRGLSGCIYTNNGDFKSAPYTRYYTKGDFNDERKQATAETYIIMQAAADLSSAGSAAKPFAAGERYKLIEAGKHGDGRGNTYIGTLELQSTTDNGSRAKYEANPGRYINAATMWRPATVAEMIDKSGYLLRERRQDLKRRAEQLRREKAAAAYQATDDREKVNEIRGMIENMKAGIIAALKAAASYDEISAVHTMIDRYPDGLKWIVNQFETYEEKTNAKSYTSINAAERTYTELKKNLQKWQPAQAAAAEA